MPKRSRGCSRTLSWLTPSAVADILAKLVDEGEHIVGDGGGSSTRGEIDGEIERRFLVGGVRGEEVGRGPGGGGGEIVALAAGDLGIEDAHQSGGDIGAGRTGSGACPGREPPRLCHLRSHRRRAHGFRRRRLVRPRWRAGQRRRECSRHRPNCAGTRLAAWRRAE